MSQPPSENGEHMNHLIDIGATLALAVFASSACAHAKLQNSVPPNGATLSTAPSELRLQYNEAVEPAMSSVKVLGPDSRPVAVDKAEGLKADDKVLLVKVPRLPAGAYRVEWSTMGYDGHRTKGTVGFTVK